MSLHVKMFTDLWLRATIFMYSIVVVVVFFILQSKHPQEKCINSIKKIYFLYPLNHLHVISGIKSLQATVLHSSTPALVILFLSLHELFACKEEDELDYFVVVYLFFCLAVCLTQTVFKKSWE